MHELVRRLWQLGEPYHATTYFAPEVASALKATGLKGWWMGYFAARAAAMGPVSAGPVIAAFYHFAPPMVRRAIPDAWTFASPDAVRDARASALDDVLRRALRARPDDGGVDKAVEEAVGLLRHFADHADPAGRPLYAAHAELPWPAEPHLALWHGLTLLREHRGDGHVAALVSAGVDGCESHHLMVAGGAFPEDAIRPYRGWSDEEWDAARDRLRSRTWLLPDGRLSEIGRVVRREVEARTDALAAAPWKRAGHERAERLAELLLPIAETVRDARIIPYPNPMGVPPPEPMQEPGGA